MSFGGPTRLLMAMARHAQDRGSLQHRVVALGPSSEPVRRMVEQAGLPVTEAPPTSVLSEVLAEADVVLLHFWNTPQLDAQLRRAWPPTRLVVWCHVAGHTPPQLVTRDLISFADLTLASSPFTARLPAFIDAPPGATGCVWAGIDFGRLSSLAPRPHETFNVGYVGLVDDIKLHPRYVAMSAAVRVRSARFVVCGDGAALRRIRGGEADAAGLAERFQFRGWVRDMGPVLEELDVLGHPLSAETSAACEGAVQEAMYASVPPVVFPHGGLVDLVRDGETGLIVRTEAEYAEALTHLAEHPGERRRLGANARAWATSNFDAAQTSRAFDEVFKVVRSRPRRVRVWPTRARGLGATGAERFVEWLGRAAGPFVTSLASAAPEAVLAAEREIALSSPQVVGPAAGGIVHYRTEYPDDPHLRLWSGLALEHRGRHALAVGEFDRARRLGLADRRVRGYLRRAAAAAGAADLVAALGRDAAPANQP